MIHKAALPILLTMLLTMLLTTLNLAAFADDELTGRLFTTAAERARLDQLRQQKLFHPDMEATLDGVVIRSDGKNMAWLNQIEQIPGQSNALQISQRPGQAAAILVRTMDGDMVRVKVGDTLDRVSGKVRKVYEQPPAAPVNESEK